MWAFLCRVVLLAALGLASFSILTFSLQFPHVAVVAGVVLMWKYATRPSGWEYGTARLTTADELIAGGFLEGDDGLLIGKVGPMPLPSRASGLRMLCNPMLGSSLACRAFLGTFYRERWLRERHIRVRGITHLSTYAPVGRGKGTACLIPNLLSYRQSCICFDPKGELFLKTHEHRMRELRQAVYLLDPFGVTGYPSDTYNPLDFFDSNDPTLLDMCRDVGNQLVVRPPAEREPHWNDKAENVIGNLLYYICKCETSREGRSLETLCRIVSSPKRFRRALAIMRRQDDPLLRELGHSLRWLQDRELFSAMSTVMRHVLWLQSPLAGASFRISSFDPKQFRKRPSTLYLVLPDRFLSTMQGMLRIWLGSTMRELTRRGAIDINPILYLIDEASQVGQMRVLENAVMLYRGYGIRCWFFWQSVDQVRQCFGEKANIIMGNMDVSQYFGTSDFETADAISRRIGESTVEVQSKTRSKTWTRSTGSGASGSSTSYADNISTSRSHIARRLLFASEILLLPRNLSLTFILNRPPILGELVHWYADRSFKRGGTGRQSGVGLAAGIMAVFTLAASVLFSGLFTTLPVPFLQRLPRPVGSYSGGLGRTPARGQKGRVRPSAPTRVPRYLPKAPPARRADRLQHATHGRISPE